MCSARSGASRGQVGVSLCLGWQPPWARGRGVGDSDLGSRLLRREPGDPRPSPDKAVGASVSPSVRREGPCLADVRDGDRGACGPSCRPSALCFGNQLPRSDSWSLTGTLPGVGQAPGRWVSSPIRSPSNVCSNPRGPSPDPSPCPAALCGAGSQEAVTNLTVLCERSLISSA